MERFLFCVFIRPVELTRHNIQELLTFKVLLLHYPISTLVTLIRESHQWVWAPSTLVKTIVSEAWVTFADRCGTLLIARAMAVAIDCTSQLSTDRVLFTESICIAIVSLFALRAVKSCKVWMTLAPKLVALFDAVTCAYRIALTDTRADFEIKRVGQVRHDSARQGELTVSQWLRKGELIAYALVQSVLSKANYHSVVRACLWLKMWRYNMVVHPCVIGLSIGEYWLQVDSLLEGSFQFGEMLCHWLFKL